MNWWFMKLRTVRADAEKTSERNQGSYNDKWGLDFLTSRSENPKKSKAPVKHRMFLVIMLDFDNQSEKNT